MDKTTLFRRLSPNVKFVCVKICATDVSTSWDIAGHFSSYEGNEVHETLDHKYPHFSQSTRFKLDIAIIPSAYTPRILSCQFFTTLFVPQLGFHFGCPCC